MIFSMINQLILFILGVYLVRFVVLQDQEESSELPWEESSSSVRSLPLSSRGRNR